VKELYELFCRCLPFAVREEAHARALLSAEENRVFTQWNEEGKLIGAAVVHKNNILLLCVEEACRGQGIGSQLLEKAEAHIRAAGFDSITVGAGEDYLVPGVPGRSPAVKGDGLPAAAGERLGDGAVTFFEKRGYTNSWGCCCFDMRMDMADFILLSPMESVIFRWAEKKDMPGVLACTDDACEEFTRYYRNEALYTGESSQRVLIAEENGSVVGTLIVSFETEAPGLGSVGCTTVRSDRQGNGIATHMVNAGTQMLKKAGLQNAFLGYTYTGLDKMYGASGYHICCHYFMAQKTL